MLDFDLVDAFAGGSGKDFCESALFRTERRGRGRSKGAHGMISKPGGGLANFEIPNEAAGGTGVRVGIFTATVRPRARLVPG